MRASRWRSSLAGITLAATLVASPASARDLVQILLDKGVITQEEAAELREAKPPAAAAAGSKAAPAASVAGIPEWLSKVTPSGDVRVRSESFFREGDPNRFRQRFRLRLGAKVAVSEETELGFKLVSASSGELIANNSTFDDTFTFKDIQISNAYLRLAPAKSFGWARPYVHLLGGKFDVPVYTPPTPTGLVFDRDLSPEGAFESFRLLESADSPLRALSLNFGQWIFEESSRTGDSAIFAFQGTGTLAISDGVTLQVGVADYLFHKASTIAVAKNKNPTIVVSNAVRLSDGSVVSGRAIDATKLGMDGAGKPITIASYVSDFNLVNAAADLAIATPWPALPLKLFVDSVINTEAVGAENTGYEVGFQVGADKSPGDFAFGYAWEHLETDATISAFSESDYGADGGTNTEGHILRISYVLLKSVSLLSSAYITEPIEDVAGRNPETSSRWQVDLLARF